MLFKIFYTDEYDNFPVLDDLTKQITNEQSTPVIVDNGSYVQAKENLLNQSLIKTTQ
jgi:hypothetical protein